MLLDLGSQPTGEIPAEWDGVVARLRDGFVVRGDDAAAADIFLTDQAGVLVSDNIEELAGRMRESGVDPAPSSFSVSALLHNGLIPPPYSEFEGIYTLTMGDVVRVSWAAEQPRLDFEIDYPWLARKSRNDNRPSERKLLDLLTAATARDVDAAGGQGFLMLSSGKDSGAVALALAEAGRKDIPCVTYSAGPEDPEPMVAADICRRLGLEHRVVTLPSDQARVADILTRFFEESPRPGTDLKQIPYVLATAQAGSTDGVVIDGGGNDSYMGYPVTGKWAAKTRLRLRSPRLIDFVQKRVPVDSPINYVARSRLETIFSGRMPRFHETRTFFPQAVDTRNFWYELSRESAGLDLFDLYALSERYVTPPTSMKKHVLATQAIGHRPSVPWCDQELAEYYFHLPEEHRYDKKRGINKVLLRRMLLQYLDYDAEEIGKHYFSFEGARFVVENREFVRSEIDACALWERDQLGVVHDWLDTIDSRPLLHHAILTVFMVSGWHNHSRLGVPALAAQPADA